MKAYEYIIPIEGLLRDPITMDFLPKEGASKSMLGKEGKYWRRRIKDGSVIIGKPSVPVVKIKKKKEIKTND